MSKYKVIVVDDDEAVCDTLTTILRRRGFDAEGYGDAERFLTEAFDVRHPHTEQPDLVMIDLLLGNDKMQGMDLIKELVARDISSEILVISGTRSPEDLLPATMLGASDWVVKPFNYITLMPRLTTLAETGRKRRLHRDVNSPKMDVTRLARPVFLSYSEKDRVLASVIRRYLEARGIGVWYAPTTIRVGDPWQDRISEGIQDAKIFVALFTDSYFTRPYCIDELIEFDQRTKTSPKPKPKLFALTFGFSEATRRNPTFQDIRNRHHSQDMSEHRFVDGLTDLLLQVEDCLACLPDL